MPPRRGGEECPLSNSSSSLLFFFQISWCSLIASTHFRTVEEAKTCLCGLPTFPFSGNKCCCVYLQIRSQPGQPHCPRSLKNLSIFEKHSFHLFFFFSPGWVFSFCKVRKDKAKKSLWYSSWKKGMGNWSQGLRSPPQHLPPPPAFHQRPREAVEWAVLNSQLMRIRLNLKWSKREWFKDVLLSKIYRLSAER